MIRSARVCAVLLLGTPCIIAAEQAAVVHSEATVVSENTIAAPFPDYVEYSGGSLEEWCRSAALVPETIEALQECLRELEINPYSSAAKKRLGRIHVQLRDADKALPYLREIAAADSEDPDVRTDLGRAYELLGKRDEALLEYQEALRIDPTLNRVHYVLARIYRQLGRKDLAQEEFRLFKANEEEDRRKRVERIQRLRQREAEADNPR